MNDLTKEEDDLYDEKKFHSGKISESSRYIGYGLVAFYYGIATSDYGIAMTHAPDTSVAQRCLIIVVGVLGVASLLLDYSQYLAGYFSVKKAIANPNRAYKTNSWPRWFQEGAFWAKQVTALAGAISLIAWVLVR